MDRASTFSSGLESLFQGLQIGRPRKNRVFQWEISIMIFINLFRNFSCHGYALRLVLDSLSVHDMFFESLSMRRRPGAWQPSLGSDLTSCNQRRKSFNGCQRSIGLLLLTRVSQVLLSILERIWASEYASSKCIHHHCAPG